MTIGQRIAAKRKEKNLSQEQLGEALNVSRQSVYRWEKDATIPELDKLMALSKLFDVSLGWLLGEESADSMTGEQLRMVGEITGRCLAASQPRKRRSWISIFAAIVIAALLAVLLIPMGSHVAKRISGLQDTVSELQDTISSFPGEMESLLNDLLPEHSPEEEPSPDPYDPTTWPIPVVYITGESLTDWGGKEDVRQAVLSYTEGGAEVFSRSITIKPQGSSSLLYDKKNFTIKLDGSVTLDDRWGAQDKYCLKANYIDPTHAGNVVSARLAGQMNAAYGVLSAAPNHGSIDGFPCWVVLNGEPAGLYCWNIPKDAWMFGMDEENPNHIVMCGEEWSDACMFFTTEYTGEDWSVEAGPDDEATREKFTRLLDFVVYSSDEEFVEHFHEYLDLDACLNYYCFMCVSNASDNGAKNMLLATYDGQIWAPALYDLDSLWGIEWDGLSLDLDSPYYLPYHDSGLWSRIRYCFEEELYARYAELRQGVLSEEVIWASFEGFIGSIPAEAYELDSAMWNPDGELIRTPELMKICVAEYLPRVDEAFGYGQNPVETE